MEWGMSPMSAQPLPLIQLKSSLFHLFIQKRFSLNWKVWHFEFFAVTANFHNLFSVSVSLYWFVEMFSSAWWGSSSRSLNAKHVDIMMMHSTTLTHSLTTSKLWNTLLLWKCSHRVFGLVNKTRNSAGPLSEGKQVCLTLGWSSVVFALCLLREKYSL